MSTPTHNFLPLIPATHRTASISSPFTSPVEGTNPEDSLVEALQKNRRSSSSASADSNSIAAEPALLADVVESPIDTIKSPQVEQVGATKFLKLGN